MAHKSYLPGMNSANERIILRILRARLKILDQQRLGKVNQKVDFLWQKHEPLKQARGKTMLLAVV